jgi:hypothetical protein
MCNTWTNPIVNLQHTPCVGGCELDTNNGKRANHNTSPATFLSLCSRVFFVWNMLAVMQRNNNNNNTDNNNNHTDNNRPTNITGGGNGSSEDNKSKSTISERSWMRNHVSCHSKATHAHHCFPSPCVASQHTSHYYYDEDSSVLQSQRHYACYQRLPASRTLPIMFHGEHLPSPCNITAAAAAASSSSSSSVSEVQYPVVSAPPKKKRIGVACTNCRASHKKCSEERPCRTCLDLGIPHLCCDSAPSQTKKATKPVTTTTTTTTARNVSVPPVNTYIDDRRSVNRQTAMDPYYYNYFYKDVPYPQPPALAPPPQEFHLSHYNGSHYNLTTSPQSYPESFTVASASASAAAPPPPPLVPAHFIPTPPAVVSKRVNTSPKSTDLLMPSILEEGILPAPKPCGRAAHSSLYKSQYLFHPYSDRSYCQYRSRSTHSPASKLFETNEEKSLHLAPLVNCPEDRTEPQPTPLLPEFKSEISLPSFERINFSTASNK